MSSKTAQMTANDFYADVLSEAERARLEAAREMEGIDEEVAILRIKLRDQMMQNPQNMGILFKGINMLTKAVATQYKLSPKSKDDLNDSIIGVINGIGRELWPEGGP